MDPGHVDPELSDRPGADGTDDARQFGGDGIQSPPDAVITQDIGSKVEHLFDRPVPGPVLHMDQWGGRGQPVGHQGLDHLTVGGIGDIAHRAGPVDDTTDVETSAELGDDRERPQCLFHAGLSVADPTSGYGDLLGGDCIVFLRRIRFKNKRRRYPKEEMVAEPGARQRRAQERIASSLGEIGFALPGSLVWRSTKCGKAGCHCQDNPPVLHGPYLTWTRSVDGRTVTRKITEDQQAHYQEWFDNARKLHQLVRELETLSIRAFEQAEGTTRR